MLRCYDTALVALYVEALQPSLLFPANMIHHKRVSPRQEYLSKILLIQISCRGAFCLSTTHTKIHTKNTKRITEAKITVYHCICNADILAIDCVLAPLLPYVRI